jgi:1-phosphatidylinositol-3-phosphate 5-kinase
VNCANSDFLGICGNIFDAKCTSLVPGKLFGQSGRLRICKPCEAIVHGTDDDSSVYSDDADRASLAGHPLSPRFPADYDQWQSQFSMSSSDMRLGDDHMNIGTPTMGVPISRKPGESKRRSAVIEFDGHHSLPRPSSSRSLKSLSGRPRSSSHKRHNSRYGHQHMKSLKSFDDRAPFQRHESDSSLHGSLLPAFHHDNIIDPDLAAFLSDEGSSEDEPQSIFATMSSDPSSPGKTDSERAGFAGLLASVRRGKPWGIEKSAGAVSVTSREADNISLSGRNSSRHNRKRNLSISSAYHPRSSPRRAKSNSLLKGFVTGHSGPSAHVSSLSKTLPLPTSNSKMIRSSSMRGDAAPAVELNQASLQHVRRLLRQMIQDAEVTDAKRWEKALMPILLQCTDDVNPDIQRNDDIDIRHYIKLKKIPGGKPGDTSYVSGVVFTKNLALKSMPRSIPNPRIAIVTFPIEYARHHQHFMSLDPVISQEREYLRNLVTRIAALNPQVLLVEKNVAGLALEFLEAAGIAVVYNVKPSVLNAVSRIAQTKLITSPDKLAVDPSHLGKSASFDVKTYVHGTMKKTFVYLSGCQKDLGCTIVLRGADMKQLRKLKRITEFMCYVVYNLKLETCVMRDEYVLIPATLSGGTLKAGKTPSLKGYFEASKETAPLGDGTVESKLSTLDNSDDLDAAGPDILGATPHDIGIQGQPYSVDKDAARIAQNSSAMPSFYNDVVEKHKTKIISASPFVKFAQPYLLSQAREQEAKLSELKRLRDQYAFNSEEEFDEKSSDRFELVKPEMVHRLVEKPSKQVRDFLFAVHNAQYEKAMHNYQTQKRQWELYLSGNSSLFDPINHQRIAVLYSMVNSKTSSPCVGPDVIALSFYNEHDLEDNFLPDITLGQYVEDLCQGVNTTCTANGCEEPMFNHHRQYVHGEGQMSVIVTKCPPRMRGMQNTILMWSCCRVCGQETQVIPMSENTWKYSFGKYLELTFWSTDLHPRAHACPHDIHKNHVRYFGFNNVAVRIQWDPVELHEIIVPRATITWKVDSDLELKNDQYQKFKGRLDRFMASVKHRIESIQVDSVAPEKTEDCRAEVVRLIKRANEDHDALTQNLQEKYMNSRYYEIIPLNKAAKAIHEVSIEWDDIFTQFEKDFFPSEKDIRRLAEKQINNFLNRNASTTSIGSIEEGSEDVLTELKDTMPTTNTPSPELATRLSTTLSPEDTHNALASMLKEEQLSEQKSAESLTLPLAATTNLSEVSGSTPQSAEAQMEAVEREDVKHLDLAVPADLPSKSDNSTTKGFFNSTESSGDFSNSSESQPLELSPQVSHTVDQMRTSLEVNMPESASHETRIPRPAPAPSTKTDSKVASPPLTRTRSQPQATTILKRDRHNDSTASSSNSSLGVFGIRERLGSLVNNPSQAFDKRMGTGGTFRRSSSRSFIPRSVPGNQRNESSRVLTLKQHFEQLSKEFEKQRMRERQQSIVKGRQQRAYPFASSNPVVDVYRDAHEAVEDQELGDEEEQIQSRVSTDTSHMEDSSIKDTAAPNAEAVDKSGQPDDHQPEEGDSSPQPLVEAAHHSDVEGGDGSDTEPGTSDGVPDAGLETPMSPNDSQLDLQEFKHERNSILKIITSFWSERSASGWSPLEYPFSANEHVWGDSDIVVREDEPSSLIALALSSADYQEKVRIFRGLPEKSATEEEIDASIESNLLHPKNTNIRYAFQNRGVRAQCKIFYAESFDALRRKCGIADRFVESLSRSLKWDSKGGKTKSLFLKTLDDRFVLKSLSQVEVNSFFKFAPNYFAFMHQNLFHQLPSVIAKMMGLFQVTIRSPQSGLEFNWYMLVMENLFYDRTPNRRFDLKGSMRNRKIQSTGEADEVLLDENLVDIIFEKPIFVREHTMKLLKSSVWNDTLFLSKQKVMDYSLMAGFDDATKEIIVGIIGKLPPTSKPLPSRALCLILTT